MFEPSFVQSHSPYDYDHAAHHSVNVGEEDEGAGMAGVGARRLAKRMAAQQEEIQRRWQAEQNNLLADQLRMQNEFQESMRVGQYIQNGYQNDYAPGGNYTNYHHESKRSHQWQNDDSLRMHQEHSNSQIQNQDRYAKRDPQRDYSLKSATKPTRSQTSNPHTLPTGDVRRTRRQDTTSHSTARQEDYGKQEEEGEMIPDGFGGMMLQVPEPKVDLRQRTSTATNARTTVYDDDYEESEHVRSTDDTALRREPSKLIDTPISPIIPLRGDENGIVVRETILEPLPKATCADCGEQLPFEDLVQHECVKDACRSPLLQKGAESISSRTCSPMPDQITPAKVASRSPFFDRYERTEEEGGNRSFLSPALTASSISATSSPLLSTKKLPSDSGHSPRSNQSPLLGSDHVLKTQDKEEVRQRSQRKKQIEAQRAAKKQALIDQTEEKRIAEARNNSLAPQISQKRSHRRGAESGSSSISTTSSKSSASSLFVKRIPETLTPSSSNEMVSSTDNITHSKSRSPKKKTIDLEDLEGLMNDINADSSPISKTKKRSVKEKASCNELQRHGRHVPHHVRKPSETSLKQRNMAVTKAAEIVLTGHDVAPRSLDRPKVSRTRTKDTKEEKLCSVCLCTFHKGQPIVEREGKLFCVDDYAELYLEKCRKCKSAVRTVGVRSKDGALTGLFHRECFSCLQCDATFDDGTFYVFENAAYCSQHYHLLNGTLCQGCHSGIEGQCRQLNETGERFHQHCFTCQFDNGKEFCKDLLQDYFMFHGKRLCEWHFEKVLRSVKRRERRGGKKENESSDAIAAAEIKAARRTTMLRTVAAKKGRA